MATLYAITRFDRVYLALAANPSDYVQCGTSSGRSEVFTQEGGFRQYADNVTRVILGTSSTNVHTFMLHAVTQQQQALMSGWAGKTVLFRDTYGRRVYGTFLSYTVANIKLTALADFSITLQDVTYSDVV